MPNSRLLAAKNRLKQLDALRPPPLGALNAMSDALGLELPHSFRQVCDFFDGTGITSQALLAVRADEDPTGIAEQTVRYREELALPQGWLVLASADDSVWLLRCSQGKSSHSEEVCQVARQALAAWILGQSGEATRTWPDYLTFLEDVLRQEEAQRSHPELA